MARRGGVLANSRGPRNQGPARTNSRNRTRNRNTVSDRNTQNRRNVRRVFKNRNYKGNSGALSRMPAGNKKNNESGGQGNNNRRGRFRRRPRNFRFRRFNSNLRSKQNFKKNKEAKTADQMDMELDSYMGGEAAKARMDADLNKYFSQTEGSGDKQ